MPAPRVLFVKLSSLGDVVHLMPAVTDLAVRHPEVQIGWAVEDAYLPLVTLHAALALGVPVPLRALRKDPFSATKWRHLRDARRAMRVFGPDLAIDAQGLLKSAFVARMSGARRVAGLGFGSARENAAALFYGARHDVPRAMHAVERNRMLVAKVFGYPVQGRARYGLAQPATRPLWAPRGAYAVLLHAASRADKQWDEAQWIALGQRLAADGYSTVFPGGSDAERLAAARLAMMVPNAMAAPPMDLAACAALISHASLVAGVDTGLTHLAVAYERRTVGIYTATRPELTGLHGEGAVNLGGPGAPPSVEAVIRALGVGSP